MLELIILRIIMDGIYNPLIFHFFPVFILMELITIAVEAFVLAEISLEENQPINIKLAFKYSIIINIISALIGLMVYLYFGFY
jgi:hypothetical protein